MSELPIHEDESASSLGSDPTSVGLYLAGQRRLRGISIDDLAARTRIPRRNIERLEAGAFDAAPDGFSRGFVRTVAQALGLDADEAVMRLMTEPQLDDSMLLHERRMALMLRAVLLAGGVLLGVAIWKLFVAISVPGVADTDPGVVYRRDPVKLLAAERAQQARAGASAVVPADSDAEAVPDAPRDVE